MLGENYRPVVWIAFVIFALLTGGMAIFSFRNNQKEKGAANTSSITEPKVKSGNKLNQHTLAQPSETTDFIVLGSLEIGRYHHISALQPSGDVLIVGGYSDDNIEAKVLASAELFNIKNRTSTSYGRMTERRYFAAATLLDNNTLLISGGAGENGQPLDTAELYSFSTGKFLLTEPMTVSRLGHTATKLQNGKVLIAGGHGGNAGRPLASAEIYDPIENNFTITGSMNKERLTEHTPNAILLKDGRVLIAGGGDGVNDAIASMEFYDPDKGVFTTAGNMALKRASHTLTLLSDGKVLIVGGYANESGHLVSAEIYNPNTDKTILTQNMKVPHFHHSATLLPDDKVLIVGGNSPVVEVYNPKLNAFSVIGNLNHSRHLHTAILMPSGQVLIIGGTGSTNSSRTIEISPVLVSAKAA